MISTLNIFSINQNNFKHCTAGVPNLFIAADRLTVDNTSAALERKRRWVKPASKLIEVHACKRVLSNVTVIHVISGMNVSCTAGYVLIHALAPVPEPGVGELQVKGKLCQ